MPRRFFCPSLSQSGELTLSGSEAAHLIRVLRAQTGDTITVFDGHGSEATASICRIEPDRVILQILNWASVGLDRLEPLTIAVSVPKGERFQWMIEKLTELGVHRVIPLLTQRSVVDPGQGKLEKARKVIIEASKQCGRAVLMELSEPVSWRECLELEFPGHQTFIADPTGQAVTSRKCKSVRSPLVLIGPEGGFTEKELSDATGAGAERICLGPYRLRIETAAVVVAALNFQRSGESATT